ncbi:hypothetical protein KEM52_005841 [Ascosphaera acerosa]|nr:hypothetical protein KEM52_005841 [Ascosphaera acerosa]
MAHPDEAVGFRILSADKCTDFKRQSYKLKPFADDDVDIKIMACGICSSDIHTITGGWGDQKFPLCVGHEIIGKVIRVGPKVTTVKPGDRVGVGAQVDSCRECRQCKNGNENYCPNYWINTYGAEWPGTNGLISQGGYGSHIRTPEHWVFPIPAALDTNTTAPMLCAGITTYSPLVRNGCGPGKKVGILGLGGLGHFGVQFAKALGAETWVISRTRAKEAEAKQLGADGFIATAEEGWAKQHRFSFDIIINCANSSKGFPIDDYISVMDVHGRFISVGLPEEGQAHPSAGTVFKNAVLIGTSHLGNRQEMLDMLNLAAEKGIKAWVEEMPINEQNLAQCVERMRKGDVRYRFTLTKYEDAFGN